MGKAAKTPIRVKVWITGHPVRQQHRLLFRLLTVGMISGAIAITMGGIGLAVQLIVNPGAVSWMRWIVPDWQQQPLTAKILQTPDEIGAEAASIGYTVGKPIYFSTYPGLSKDSVGFHDFLLPFYKTESNCQTVSSQVISGQDTSVATAEACPLVELRVYRTQTSALHLPKKTALELVDRLSVAGPEELAAIAPLINAGITDQGSSRTLPISDVTFVRGEAPLPGIWLQTSGLWQRGSSRTLYGQIVRYDPARDRLQSLLSWTSPAEQFPAWQQITGGAATELLIDQTIGLEPQFQVYQFAALNTPGKPIQAKPIDLRTTAMDNRTYEHGLLLARHGLWSTALQVLEQSQNNTDWSALAQAQIDLVDLHANVTQAQAQREWSSPAQQISALLIDGRWADALIVLRTAHANGYATSNLLADHSDRLRQRVEAAVRVNPHLDVLNWGVLLTAVQKDRDAGTAWLQQWAKSSGDRQAAQILDLLDPLPITTVASSLPVSDSHASLPTPVPAATLPVSTAPVIVNPPGLIGSARSQMATDPTDWFTPNSAALELPPAQIWYNIQIIGFQDGSQWQQFSLPNWGLDENTTETAQMLWQRLGLSQDATLHLITWTGAIQPHTLQVTAKAIRVIDGRVHLLAIGTPDIEPDSSASLLVMTLATLSWLEPLDTSTLSILSQQPLWSETLVSTLWHELQQTPSLLPAAITNAGMLLREFGGWSIQLMELTGDDQPEAVLTLQTDALSANSASLLNQSQTLIFSKAGRLLYSDRLQPGRSLKAFVDLGNNNLPALIISDAEGYQIQRWSVANQQFE